MVLRFCITATLVLASSSLPAQLKIENPKRLDVPEHLAQALFLTTSRMMEAEFHSPGSAENQLRMRLVLGETPERLIEDDPFGNGTIYLERWNENKFAFAAMRLAILHLLGAKRQEHILQEIVGRSHKIAPVSAAQLPKEPQPQPSLPLTTHSSCVRQITDASAVGIPCGPPRTASRTALPYP
jgi:hypothetical protein